MRPFVIKLILLLLLGTAGCSVKENREMCPCRLELDFTGIDTLLLRYADIVVSTDGGFRFTDVLDVDDFRSGLVLDVPREIVNVGVWSGAGRMFDGNAVRIPVGEDCPPVYFHASVLDASAAGIIRETVRMGKNHCVMKVVLEGVEPADVGIRGNIDGYLPDGRPSAGEFSCRIRSSENIVVLPRQTDNSLMMDLNDGSGILKSFALGEYISDCGYDWTESDLKDLELVIDVAVTRLTLNIQDIDAEYHFDLSI